MSDQIKIEELSNNRYMINNETIIYAPNIETAKTRYESNLYHSLKYKEQHEFDSLAKDNVNLYKILNNILLEKSDNSEEHY